MSLAQQLYELGWITYPRTDANWVSQEFVDSVARELGGATNTQSSKKNKKASAHEAIRVTHPALDPPPGLTPPQRRLYKLIRERSVASVRPPTPVTRYEFGVEAVWRGSLECEDPDVALQGATHALRSERARMVLHPRKARRIPRRFSEATLVAEMDRLGIGRPSTFASILHRLLDKQHVTHTNTSPLREDCGLLQVPLNNSTPPTPLPTTCSIRDRQRGVLRPTPMALEVCRCVSVVCPEVMDTAFTAQMEAALDQVALGRLSWLDLLRSFLARCDRVAASPPALVERLKRGVSREALSAMERREFPELGMVVRLSRFGPVLERRRRRGGSAFVGIRGLLQQLDQDHMDIDAAQARAIWAIREGRHGKDLRIGKYGLYRPGQHRISKEDAKATFRQLVAPEL
jgi:DNA topoisomerase IA